MQAFNNGEEWTNEMDTLSAPDVPPNPNLGLGGAGVGLTSQPLDITPLLSSLVTGVIDGNEIPATPPPGNEHQTAVCPIGTHTYAIQAAGFTTNASLDHNPHGNIAGRIDSSQTSVFGPSDDGMSNPYQTLVQNANSYSNMIGFGFAPRDFATPVSGPSFGFTPLSSLDEPWISTLQGHNAYLHHDMLATASYIQQLPSLQISNDLMLPFVPLSQQAQVAQVTPVAPAPSMISALCTQFGCQKTFKRDADRIRHEAAVHGVNRLVHLCPVPGCPKGQGAGYKRKDKLTEHLWKKHADLGFSKRV